MRIFLKLTTTRVFYYNFCLWTIVHTDDDLIEGRNRETKSQYMQNTKNPNSGTALITKLLAHFEGDENKLLQYLGGDTRVSKALIKSAKLNGK